LVSEKNQIKILNFSKTQKIEKAEKKKNRKKKKDATGPAQHPPWGAAPGRHRPGWCIAPP
jgi:hypothetical protein